MEEKVTSRQLLDKVYNHLNNIDVSALSMDELKDFLEVVQKGQFLESYGTISPALSGSGWLASGNPCRNCGTESPDNGPTVE